MFDDDFLPQKQKPKPLNLEPLSIDELHELIADLQGEIARAEQEIAKKEASAKAADMFFKKP